MPPDEVAAEGRARLVGLMGFPVGHSASPAMHQAAFRALGLDWLYVLLEVPPHLVGDAVRGLRALGFAGANVTIPHKQAVVPFVDALAPEAQRTGAVNTLVVDGTLIVGHNTDVTGFARAVADAGVELRGATVAVLGAGGAARAAAAACRAAGSRRVVVAARRMEQGRALVEGLPGAEAVPLDADALRPILETADLLVNATPLGMQGVGQGQRLVELAPPERLPAGAAVLDMVYRPLRTPLLEAARRAGRRTITGAAMLLYQGAEAFELWTGRAAPVAVMAEALARELGAADPSEAGLASSQQQPGEAGQRQPDGDPEIGGVDAPK